MTSVAHCSCGSLQAEAVADPIFVVACHCIECQRRTGAPFGVSAFFGKADVRTNGLSTIYVRDGQEGKLRFHFCPTCGTTVYWFADLLPDCIGIAVGAFADPSFAKPMRSIWERTRHPWVAFDHLLEHFPEGTSARDRLGTQ
jgi:hypothetical protein